MVFQFFFTENVDIMTAACADSLILAVTTEGSDCGTVLLTMESTNERAILAGSFCTISRMMESKMWVTVLSAREILDALSFTAGAGLSATA